MSDDSGINVLGEEFDVEMRSEGVGLLDVEKKREEFVKLQTARGNILSAAAADVREFELTGFR